MVHVPEGIGGGYMGRRRGSHLFSPSAFNLYRPWAVLITGVNGIHKTDSIYKDWYREVLDKALVSPQWEESKG